MHTTNWKIKEIKDKETDQLGPVIHGSPQKSRSESFLFVV